MRQLAEQLKFQVRSGAHSPLSGSMLSMSNNMMMSQMRLNVEVEADHQSSKPWFSPILQSSARREVIDVYSGSTPLDGAWFSTDAHKRAASLKLAEKIDFSSFKQPLGRCSITISETENRAIQLSQLDEILTHAHDRLQHEVWMTKGRGNDKPQELGSLKQVSLYDLADYVIRPTTARDKTSMVEFLASGPQKPDYFVSCAPRACCELMVLVTGKPLVVSDSISVSVEPLNECKAKLHCTDYQTNSWC